MSLRLKLRFALLLCILPLAAGAPADERPVTAPPPGLRENTPRVHALVGARLVLAPGKVVDKGTLVIRDGVIVAAGADVAVPEDARVWKLAGKTVYAGFIDAYSEQAAADAGSGPGYWNAEVRPQSRVSQVLKLDPALNKKLRSQGITLRLVAPAGGIIRGTSALVSTGDDDLAHVVLRDNAALHIRLTPPAPGREQYPTAPLGAFALVRQAFYDADWYARALDAYETAKDKNLPRPEQNAALAALQPYRTGERLVIVDAPDELYALRADQLAKEFGLNVAVRGSGNEYRRLAAVKAMNRTVIVPLNFPKAPHVKTPEATLAAPLEDLLHWDLAPENLGRLAAGGVKVAITSKGLPEQDQFLKQLRLAVTRGLTREAALQALTTAPAELFRVANRLGTLEPGKLANLIVTDGDVFDEKSKILETWVDGWRYEVQPSAEVDARGTWQASITTPNGSGESAPSPFTLELGGEPTKLAGALRRDDKQAELTNVQLDAAQLSFAIPGKSLGWDGIVQLSATLLANGTGEDAFTGSITWANGRQSTVIAKRANQPSGAAAGGGKDEKKDEKQTGKKADSEKDKPRPQIEPALFAPNYPLGAFGRAASPPLPKAVLFINATVWTCGPPGILKQGSVLIENGRITQVAAEVKPPDGATIIDCQGRHITPGLIDCHSHICMAQGGINEDGQTITAEVRVGDFIDSDDINIYRQLAGGVTTSNILHGSANTIGGQNQVIKLRWGALPEEMKFTQAPPSIKFALGENVKQSNWGDKFTVRYPQTRMGVDQLIRDAFAAAREYHHRWEAWNKKPQGLPPRVDLELEALWEILAGKRMIHCHSYRQDEILAFIRTCDDFKVRIGTLQHILEGYKLADAMVRHGVGGSAFSDWWAYKFEVYDAIPYNAAIMHQAGVLVSFNSDDAEMARRLNTEAAKAVKYGGVPEVEALKFVTLNSAKQLGIDGWVGSLEPGKEADLAVWSRSPLSTLTRCEQTWVDGRKYFDRHDDQRAREQNRQMRAALVQRILASGAEMAPQGETSKPKETVWTCQHGCCCRHVHHDDDE